MTDVGRLDVVLVRRGLARSRNAAAALIAAGRVRLDGRVADRAAAVVGPGSEVVVADGDDWVGRAAVKLVAALDGFGIDPRDRLALDLGASTGGFTQVLLERGARRVIALDVGHGQLVPQLRTDPRVAVIEGENARTLDAARLADLTGSAEQPSIVVADLSFISLTLVLPAIAAVRAPHADVILLIKPQFEVGRGVARGGIVTDPRARSAAVRGVLDAAIRHGFGIAGLLASPVAGTHGNVEVLAHLAGPAALAGRAGADPAEWDQRIEHVVRGDGGGTG